MKLTKILFNLDDGRSSYKGIGRDDIVRVLQAKVQRHRTSTKIIGMQALLLSELYPPDDEGKRIEEEL
jgi:hypothetical protein